MKPHALLVAVLCALALEPMPAFAQSTECPVYEQIYPVLFELTHPNIDPRTLSFAHGVPNGLVFDFALDERTGVVGPVGLPPGMSFALVGQGYARLTGDPEISGRFEVQFSVVPNYVEGCPATPITVSIDVLDP